MKIVNDFKCLDSTFFFNKLDIYSPSHREFFHENLREFTKNHEKSLIFVREFYEKKCEFSRRFMRIHSRSEEEAHLTFFGHLNTIMDLF